MSPGASPPRLVLASASPRRARCLEILGLDYLVDPARVAEVRRPGEAPEAYAERLAREKAAEVRGRHPDALVVAGDTLVVLGEVVLEKPGDEDDAVAMLLELSGRTHHVLSGLAVAAPGGGLLSGVSRTEVTLRRLDEAEARAYAATGEPLDKAGAYGIQGRGSALVRAIRGDYYTVVGLPIPLLVELLEGAGWRYRSGSLEPASAPT